MTSEHPRPDDATTESTSAAAVQQLGASEGDGPGPARTVALAEAPTVPGVRHATAAPDEPDTSDDATPGVTAEPDTPDDDVETTAVRRRSFMVSGPPSAARPTTPRPTPGWADVGSAPAASAPAASAPAASAPATPAPPEPGAREADSELTSTGTLLAGASVEPGPRSRGAAHAWAVVLTLVLSPVAWYLVTDAGTRLTLPAQNPWQSGILNPAALAELAAGLLLLAVVLLTGRWSSAGLLLTGALVAVAGLPFLGAPALTQELLDPVLTQLRSTGGIGANMAQHVLSDGSTGRIVMYGLAMVVVGAVSRGARRQGRREEKAKVDRARNREIAARRMAEVRRRSALHRMQEVERRSAGRTTSVDRAPDPS